MSLRKIYKSKKLHIVEQPPTRRTIFINEKMCTISFPYVIFVRYEGDFGSELFFLLSKTSIKSIKDKLKILNLGNTDENGYICLGTHFYSGHTTKEIIDYFWLSRWYHTNFNSLIKIITKKGKIHLSKLDNCSLKKLFHYEQIKFPVKTIIRNENA